MKMTMKEKILALVTKRPGVCSGDIILQCACSQSKSAKTSVSSALLGLVAEGVLVREKIPGGPRSGYLYDLAESADKNKSAPPSQFKTKTATFEVKADEKTASAWNWSFKQEHDRIVQLVSQEGFSDWWSSTGCVISALFAIDEFDKKLPRDAATAEAICMTSEIKCLLQKSFQAGFCAGSSKTVSALADAFKDGDDAKPTPSKEPQS